MRGHKLSVAPFPHRAAHVPGVVWALDMATGNAICKQNSNPIVESCGAIRCGSRR